MRVIRRRGAIAFFTASGVCLTALALALNITVIHISSRRLALDLLVIALSALLVLGVVLNTVFLVREIQRNERQDSFLNAVTHELKTPIASVRLYLDTLERRPLDEVQRKKFYATMRSDTDRLLATVEQVLKAGEVSHREYQLSTRIELGSLAAECISTALTRHHLPSEAIQLSEVPADARLYVMGNPEDLRTAISNLLDNAIKYSPNGVHVRAQLTMDRYIWAVLSITDTGVGIPARELKRIFKRFYRATSQDMLQIKGTGLGLFLVRTIARQHGGDVRATSEGPGKGATMYLKLPLAIGNAVTEDSEPRVA